MGRRKQRENNLEGNKNLKREKQTHWNKSQNYIFFQINSIYLSIKSKGFLRGVIVGALDNYTIDIEFDFNKLFSYSWPYV